MSTSEIYDYVLALTVEIGEVMNEGFYSTYKVETKKASWDVVTEYDRRVEDFLIKKITEKYPSHKFIAEETSAKTTTEAILTDDPTWIIDPIDGTVNFVHGHPVSAISIGFLIGKELVIGIIYNPMRKELFTACKGKGAFLNGTRIHASPVTDLETSLIGHEISLAGWLPIREKNLGRLTALIGKCHGIRSIGCAALACCYVANGSITAYHIDDLKPWDLAAGALIIREAGGCVLNPKGGEFNVMKPDIVCAGTETLCRQIISIFEKDNLY